MGILFGIGAMRVEGRSDNLGAMGPAWGVGWFSGADFRIRTQGDVGQVEAEAAGRCCYASGLLDFR